MRILLAKEFGLYVWRRGSFEFGERATGGSGDEAEDIDGFEGWAGDEEALGVGAWVRRGKEEAAIVEEGVGEGEIEGGEAFEGVVVAEGELEPDAVAAGAGEKGGAADALGIELVIEIEIFYISYVFEVSDGKGG